MHIGSLSGMIKHMSEVEKRQFGLRTDNRAKERMGDTTETRVAPGLKIRGTITEPTVLFSELLLL